MRSGEGGKDALPSHSTAVGPSKFGEVVILKLSLHPWRLLRPLECEVVRELVGRSHLPDAAASREEQVPIFRKIVHSTQIETCVLVHDRFEL